MPTEITLPPISPDTNKFKRGSLLILAGSRRYFGAGVLATLAAEKTGAGYVSLATPLSAAAPSKQHVVCSPVIEALEAGDYGSMSAAALPGILRESKHLDALCAGPGLTVNDETSAFLGEVLQFALQNKTPLLLDADALNILANNRELLRSRCLSNSKDASLSENEEPLPPLILTPHEGELQRLCGLKNSFTSKEALTSAAQDLAAEFETIVVAKGPTTFLTNGVRHKALSEATPALAKAGTGDVLAGIISSLLAQAPYEDAFDLATLGVQIHSKAGRLAAETRGVRGTTALDVIEAIPHALSSFESQ